MTTETLTSWAQSIVAPLLVGLLAGAITAYATIGVIDSRLAAVEKTVERIAVSSGVTAVNAVRLDGLEKRLDAVEAMCRGK